MRSRDEAELSRDFTGEPTVDGGGWLGGWMPLDGAEWKVVIVGGGVGGKGRWGRVKDGNRWLEGLVGRVDGARRKVEIED